MYTINTYSQDRFDLMDSNYVQNKNERPNPYNSKETYNQFFPQSQRKRNENNLFSLIEVDPDKENESENVMGYTGPEVNPQVYTDNCNLNTSVNENNRQSSNQVCDVSFQNSQLNRTVHNVTEINSVIYPPKISMGSRSTQGTAISSQHMLLLDSQTAQNTSSSRSGYQKNPKKKIVSLNNSFRNASQYSQNQGVKRNKRKKQDSQEYDGGEEPEEDVFDELVRKVKNTTNNTNNVQSDYHGFMNKGNYDHSSSTQKDAIDCKALVERKVTGSTEFSHQWVIRREKGSSTCCVASDKESLEVNKSYLLRLILLSSHPREIYFLVGFKLIPK
jgi:hypothetical protein